jgi:hypothetical protein
MKSIVLVSLALDATTGERDATAPFMVIAQEPRNPLSSHPARGQHSINRKRRADRSQGGLQSTDQFSHASCGRDPLFLYGLFRVAKPIVQRAATEAMKKMITKSSWKALYWLSPHYLCKGSLEVLLSATKNSTLTHVEALRQADHPFQTLLHQAFNTKKTLTTF